MSRALLGLVGGLWLTAGCNSGPPRPPLGIDAGPPELCADATVATVRCVGDVAYTCDGVRRVATASDDCAARGEICAPSLGCRACAPSTVRCDGETVELCRADGSGFDRGDTCNIAAGLRCSPDGCADLCAQAAEDESYVGCEYWPTTLRNSALGDGFELAIAIANPQLVPAQVHIEGGLLVTALDRTIAPGALEVVVLPWTPALRGSEAEPAVSALVRMGAFHVVSDVPVTVSQFSPLTFQVPSGCTERECFSFTNDASLLLPTHVLTGSYVAVARPTFVLQIDGVTSSRPGLVAIVGTSETPTDVEIRVTAPTLAGSPLDGPSALVPGTPAVFTLGRGDVLQLLSAAPTECPATRTDHPSGSVIGYCDPGPGFDLSGTEIRASAPVAVFSGHDCTFVPFDRWACDHLEEQVFPVESLGTDLFVPGTHAIRGEPSLLRIVSAADDNVVRFEPPIDGVPETTLDRGEHVEVEVRSPVWARATGPILGAVFLVGQDYGGLGSSGRFAVGDPAMALVVPSVQYRDEYTILAPDTYTQSWLDVAVPDGAFVSIDGVLVATDGIDGTGMGVAHVRIESGVHRVVGTAPFGLYVSGLATYTSYYVPGGMDFEPVTPPF